MRHARIPTIIGVGLTALALLGWFAPRVGAESGPPVIETGWWSQQPLAQPIADDGFAIGWALEAEQSTAAVRLDLAPLRQGTVYLQLHEAGGAAPDQGLARLCTTTDAWAPANPGPYGERPEAPCETGQVAELGRDGEALLWVADITPLVSATSDDTLSLVVRPVGKPLTDGVPTTAPFTVEFDGASVLVDAGNGPPTTSEVGSGPPIDPGAGAIGDPGLILPELGGGFEAPLVPVDPEPAASPGVTPSTTSPRPSDLVALGPVDVTSAPGAPWARLVLLVPVSAAAGCGMAAGRRWRRARALTTAA